MILKKDELIAILVKSISTARENDNQ